MIDQKRKKNLTAVLRSKRLGGGVLWKPYPSHQNGLFSPLLVLRDFTARTQINIGLYLSSCRVALRPAVLSAAQIWPSVSRYLEISFGVRGPSPKLLPPSGRLGISPGAWGAPNKGNADEAVGIFGNAGCVWAPALRPDPSKKGLVPHLPVRWGEQQIPQINIGVIPTVRDFLPFLCNSIFLVS